MNHAELPTSLSTALHYQALGYLTHYNTCAINHDSITWKLDYCNVLIYGLRIIRRAIPCDRFLFIADQEFS